MTCSRSRWNIHKALFVLAVRYIILETEETKDAQKKYQVTGSVVWNVWNKQTTNVVSIATYHRWTMEVRVVPCLARPKNAKTVQPWGYLWWWDYLLQLWFQSYLCLFQYRCLVRKTKTKQRGEVFLTLNWEKRDITRITSMYTKTKTLHVWNTFRHHGVKMVFRPPSWKAVKRSLADTSPEPSFKFYLLATISSLAPPLTPPYLIIAPLPPPLTSPFPTWHHQHHQF